MMAADNSEPGLKPGYHAGNFRLRPSVSITGKYEDNIFATDTAEEHDFITIISPRLNVDSTWDKHSLRFKLGANLGRYADFDAENYNDYWLTMDGRYDLTASTNIFGGIGYGSEHEGRDSPDSTFGGLYPTTYESRNAHLGIKTTQNDITYRIGLTYEDLDFEDVPTASGGSIINNDRDRELIGFGVRGTYRLDDSRELYAQALYDVRDYQQSPDLNGYFRNSDGYRFAVGIKNNVSKRSKAEAYIGYISQDYDDSRFDTVEALDFGGKLTFSPNANTKLTASLLRTLNETTVSGSSSYLHTSFSGKLEHKISPRLIPHFKLGYAESDYQDFGRKDEIFSAEAALKYYLAKNAYISAGYRFVERDSNDFGLVGDSDDYTNNSVFLAFTSQGYPLFEPAISDFTTQGELELGVLWLSDDSIRFGRYSGLDSSGAIITGNASITSKDQGNNWAILEGSNLGLDSRTLNLEWGAQGEYSAYLNFDQLPFTRFAGNSIFEGIGSTYLSLPTPWTRGDETADLTDLSSSLKEIEIGTMRKKLGIGSTFLTRKNWTISLGYETETKEGFQQMAGVIGHSPGDPARSVMLPAPVDYTTNTLKASFGYERDNTVLNLAYQSSFFMNNLKALTWQNPFDGVGPRGDEGSVSLAPDNEFHQLSLSGVHRLFGTTRLTGAASFAAMYQDDPFLPDSVDADLTPNALPRNSLDGEVYQTNALLALTSRPLSGLNLKASYRMQKRDNETPIATYTYHVNDSNGGAGTSTPATDTNVPYSYDKRTADLSAGYRINRMARLNGNIARETYECPSCEVSKTTEDEGNLRLRLTPDYDFQVTLRGGVSSRDGTVYQTVTGENPLLRKYNISDRDRSLVGLDVSYQPTARLALSANLQMTDDDYDATAVGLTSAKESGLTLDASYMVNKNLSGHAYIGREIIKSNQAGSQVVPPDTADWFINNDDTVDSLGFGIKWKKSHKLDLGADYVYSGAKGETFMTSQNALPPVIQFPDIESNLHSLKLYADYQWHPKTSVKFSYLYEKYDADDWSIDGVQEDTIPEVLLLGEPNPSYEEHLIGVSLITRF